MTPPVSCPFFSQAQWFAAWLAAFARSEVVEARVLDVPMPFVVHQVKRFCLAVTVLRAPVNEHSPCLRLPCIPGLDAATLDAALRELYRRRTFTWIEFPLLEADAPEVDRLRALVRHGWPVLEEEHPHTAVADLSHGWDHYHRGLSKKLRANTNRAENGLRRLGELTFSEESTRNWEAAWNDHLELERAGWKGQAQGAIKSRPEIEGFYHRVLAEAHRQGRIRLFALRLDGRLIGSNLVLVEKDKAYGWKTAYAEDLSKYSPGNVLQRHVTRALAEEGVVVLDMLDPVTDWKRRWANRTEARLHLRLFAPTLRGRVFYRFMRLRNKTKGRRES